MGVFDFVKNAGAALFGGDDEPEVKQRDLDDVLADKAQGEALTKLVKDMGLKVTDFRAKCRDGEVTLEGTCYSHDDRERLILLVGNTQGVARVVDDALELRSMDDAPAGGPGGEAPPAVESTMYTVQSGDSLSKIAKAHYGDAMKYMVIFEANTPMLKDPNKIYPGQVLRIPPLDG